MSCAVTLLIGETLTTCATEAIAVASLCVSDCCEPMPPDAPPVTAAPELMMSVFVPSPATRALMELLVPWVIVTATITAATPTITPRIVSSERSRLPQSASHALLKLALSAKPRLRERFLRVMARFGFVEVAVVADEAVDAVTGRLEVRVVSGVCSSLLIAVPPVSRWCCRLPVGRQQLPLPVPPAPAVAARAFHR